MNKILATIQKVKNVQSIPNDVEHEIVNVCSHKFKVNKGVYKINDVVVHFKYNSCLPTNVPEYEFLYNFLYKDKILEEVYRITERQGIIIPVEICFKDCMPLCE